MVLSAIECIIAAKENHRIDMILTDSIEINAPVEKVFEFFKDLEGNYKNWHPKDHVLWHILNEKDLEEGSTIRVEEYLNGKPYKAKIVITKVIKNRLIEYKPANWFYRRRFPKGTFKMKPKDNVCFFTAEVHLKINWLIKIVAKSLLDYLRNHMKEEGENLKKILENK